MSNFERLGRAKHVAYDPDEVQSAEAIVKLDPVLHACAESPKSMRSIAHPDIGQEGVAVASQIHGGLCTVDIYKVVD